MLSDAGESGSPDGWMPPSATENQRIVDLFENVFHKADATHNVSHKIHNGLVAFYRSLHRVFNLPEDTGSVAGSYREGLKISNKIDFGDIDVVFDGKVIDVKEEFFIYNETFPCYCKIMVDDKLMDKSEVLPWYSNQPREKTPFYDEATVTEYGRDGGIQGGYKVENWAENGPKLFPFLRYSMEVIREIKKTEEGFSQQSWQMILNKMLKKESECENAGQNYKWQDDIPLIQSLIHVVWLMICSGKSEQELENDFSSYLKQVLFSDDMGSDLFRLAFDCVNILGVIGSEASESDIDKLIADVWRTFPNFVPVIQTMISKLKIPAVDHICSCRVDGWPQTARLWVDRTPRNWPEKNTIDYVISQGFNLVGKPPPTRGDDDNRGSYFYLSFSRAEQLLCDSMTSIQKNTFLIFKVMIKFGKGFDVVKSYYLKTILFWALEETEAEDWKEENIHKILRLLIDRLIACFEKGNLPHYFVPKMNLLAKIEPSDCERVVQNIQILKENICCYLEELSAAHGPFIMYTCSQSLANPKH